MRLYDFSIYADRKKEQLAAAAVSNAVDNVNSPGGISILKSRVSTWMQLHHDVVKRTG